MLIFGDNLLALKALEQDFAGKVKCVFIDPPYNTGSAFTHYDDGLEHSIWLSMMRDRLELIRHLLSDSGSLWITIDDNEAHYLKVLCDEIFGRGNFVANVVWQKRTSPDIRATIGPGHDHILVFSKHIDLFKKNINKITKSHQQIKQYKNPDKDPRGPWVSSDYTAQGYRPNQMYSIRTPGGMEYTPPIGTCWKNIEPVFLKLVEEGRIWFYKIFRDDFINGTLCLGHSPVWWDNRVLPGEKHEEGFWHLISRDDNAIRERIFDPRRAERLPWCRPTIQNHDDGNDVKAWDFKETNGRIRTYLWLEKWDYVVILEKRKQKIGAIVFLVTAFYVDGDKRRENLRKKFLKRIV